MLQRIHDSFGRWIAGIILGVLAIAFVFWGVDFSMTGATFAAKVNGESIPLAEFDSDLQYQQSELLQRNRRELTDDERRMLRSRTIENLVRQEALTQRIEEMGFRVSDARLAEFIRSVPAFQVNGVFSLEVLQGMLRNRNMTLTGFEEQQREELAVLDLRDGIVSSSFETPAELRRSIELFHQRREVGYATFAVDDFVARVEVDDAAVAAQYESNQASYQTAETADLEYVELKFDDVAAGIEVTEDELRAYYEREVGRFATVEERLARHILIEIDNGDEAAARAAAEQARARIEAGEDFAAVAREISDDAGSRALGGDLGWLSRGSFAEAFEEALFSLARGDLAGPVKTELGFHVLRLEDVRAGEQLTFDEVRERLLAEYRALRADELFFERASKLGESAFDADDELVTVAAETELPLKMVLGFPRIGDPVLFANSAAVVQAAFSEDVLATGRNSELVELAADHVLVLRVTAHHPPAVQPLDVVREQIRDELRRDRARTLVETAAETFRDALEQGGDPPLLAPVHGGSWRAPEWVGRDDATVPTEALAAVFGSAQPAAGAVVREDTALANGDHVVYVLHGVEAGAPESLSQAERDAEQRQLANRFAIAELGSYSAELRSRAKIVVPDEILEPQL